MKKGKLLVISGFSGSGKGTIVKKLLNNNDDYFLSISATTRSPRNNERNGVEYYFVTHEKFEDMIKNNELLEYAKYNDNYYGTPKKAVLDKLNNGESVILEIEYQGAFQIKKQFSEAILIFIIPPSAKVLYERLKGRGTETEEQIMKRLEVSIIEANIIDQYDYIVINDDLDDTVSLINQIVNEEYNNDNKFFDIISKIVKDIKEKNYV